MALFLFAVIAAIVAMVYRHIESLPPGERRLVLIGINSGVALLLFLPIILLLLGEKSRR